MSPASAAAPVSPMELLVRKTSRSDVDFEMAPASAAAPVLPILLPTRMTFCSDVDF